MNTNDDKQLRQQFGDVLDGMADLGADIRSQSYPGIAWQAPRKAPPAPRLWLWPSAIAAAAAVVLSVGLLAYLHGHNNVVAPQPPVVVNPNNGNNAVEPSAEEVCRLLEEIASTKTPDEVLLQTIMGEADEPALPTMVDETPATQANPT